MVHERVAYCKLPDNRGIIKLMEAIHHTETVFYISRLHERLKGVNYPGWDENQKAVINNIKRTSNGNN
jgi:hypothetical protein